MNNKVRIGRNENMDKLVKALNESVDETKQDIKDLEAKKEELQEAIGDPDAYKLSMLSKKKKHIQELDIVKEAIKSANKHLEGLKEQNEKLAYSEGKQLLEEQKMKVKVAYDDLSKDIITKIYEIRELYADIEGCSKAERLEVNEFINDIAPHLSQEKNMKFQSQLLDQSEDLKRILKDIKIRTINENSYRINGLLKFDPTKEKSMYIRTAPESNEMFGYKKE